MEMGITDTITPVNGLSKHRILLKTNLQSAKKKIIMWKMNMKLLNFTNPNKIRIWRLIMKLHNINKKTLQC